MIMKFRCNINDLEFRGLEENKNKTTGDPYMIVKFDDVSANRLEFLDRDMEHKEIFKRGKFYNVLVEVNHSPKYTNFTLLDAKEIKD